MKSSLFPLSPDYQRHLPWLIVLLGLCAMYVPSFVGLFHGVWSTDEQGHGPIVLGISIWLLYRKWPEISEPATPSKFASIAGWTIFFFAWVFYVVGRSQAILLVEVGSIVWMLVAVCLVLRGGATLKKIWFPLFFMCFMVPLPGVVVDALTMPMKMAVSYVTDNVLYALGYPISRSGVILQIGQYQLFVADACSGLHTLFTLEALGLLYLNIVRHDSWIRNVSLAIAVVPISFSANVIRVCVLTLITYYFGDEAGQGFLHGFAGMVLFVSALLLIISADSLLQYFVKRWHKDQPGLIEETS